VRETLHLLIVALLVLGVGIVVWRVAFVESDSSPLTIALVRGDVELERDGASAPVIAGALLQDNDRVISGEDGVAVIAVGEESQLTLESSSAMRVVSLDEKSVEVEMEDGRVNAVVRPGGYEVSVLTGDRAVRAIDAEFSAGTRDGAAAVEVSRGSVSLEGFGGLTALQSGERILAPADGAPRRAPIPDELLLEVAWPARRSRAEAVTLRGETEPGARVSIQSPAGLLSAVADEQGRFEVTVALDAGANPVLVSSEGLLGDTRSAKQSLTRDDEGPTADFEVRY